MKTILIPVDFSDHSVPTYKLAIKIAGSKDKTQLVFLHSYNDQIMIPDSGMNAGFETDSYMNMQLIEEFKQLADNNMNNLKAEVIKFLDSNNLSNFSIKTIVEGGDASWEITSVCDDIKPNLIIMGTQGTGKKGILEGSMAKRIMIRAKTPVIAVPIGFTNYSKLSIMYASDNSEKDFGKIKLLYKLFENISVKIFAVHFHLSGNTIDISEHMKNLSDSFAADAATDRFSFSLVDADDKSNALQKYVDANQINSVAFIAHKSNFFRSLFKEKLSKSDFFKLGLPMIALHE